MAGQLKPLWLAAALCLGMASCGCGAAPPGKRKPPRPTTKGKKPMTAGAGPFITETQGLPESLKSAAPVWETYHTGNAHKSAFATRLYDNGQLYSWSDVRRVMEHNLPARKPAPYAWRLDAKVSAEGVEKVKKLVAAFGQTPTGSAPTGQSERGAVSWRSRLDGSEHTVHTAAGATADLPKAIQDIELAIQSHIVPGGVPMDQP